MAPLKPAAATRWLLAVVLVGGCQTGRSTERAEASFRRAEGPRTRLALPAPASLPRTLTLDQAVTLALARSQQLAALRAEVAVARAGVQEALALTDPQLRFSGLRLGPFPPPLLPVGLALRLTAPRPLVAGALVLAAQHRAAAAEADVRAQEQVLAGEVRLRFQRVLRLDAEAAAAQGTVQARQALAELAARRVEHALATRLDTALVSLSLQDAQVEATERTAHRDAELRALVERVGLPLDQPVVLEHAALAAGPVALPAEDAVLAQALRLRGEVVAASARLDAAQAGVKAALARLLPSPSYVQLGSGLTALPCALSPLELDGALDLPVPGLTKGGLAQATAEQERAERELDAQVEAVAREVRDRWNRLTLEAAELQAFDAGLGAAAQALEGEAQQAMDAGSVDLFKAAVILERASAIRLRRAALARSYFEALEELRTAAGGVLPEGPGPATAAAHGPGAAHPS